MIEQDRNSLYNFVAILSEQEMRIKKNIDWGILVDAVPNILRTNIIRNVWLAVRRIAKEILEAKGVKNIC